MTADKPDEVKIWQKGKHDDAEHQFLTWSWRLRRIAQHEIETLGSTASKLQKSEHRLIGLKDLLAYCLLLPSQNSPTCISTKRVGTYLSIAGHPAIKSRTYFQRSTEENSLPETALKHFACFQRRTPTEYISKGSVFS